MHFTSLRNSFDDQKMKSGVLSEDEREQIAAIFEKLDVDKNGRVSVKELTAIIRQNGVPTEEQAKSLIRKNKRDNGDENMTLNEFIHFVRDTDTQLRLAFKQLDRNNDNKVDASEVRTAMSELGVKMSSAQAQKLLAQMDKDGSYNVDIDEWIEFLRFSGSTQLRDIFGYLHKAYAFDIGDGSLLPDDFSEEERKSGEAFKTLVSGGVAGCISRTLTAPLDRLKTFWQAMGAKASDAGIMRSLSIMLKDSGPASFWYGNGVNCLKVAPESAIKFQTYEMYKQLLLDRDGRQEHSLNVTLPEKFIAGAAAGATAQSAIYPLEVLKTRMCLRKKGQYSSIFDCARKLYGEFGVGVFYRGYLPNMLGILPYAGIDLALYETFKNAYMLYITSAQIEATEIGPPPIYVSLTAGAMSSVCGQLATYPLALAKIRYQAMKTNDKPSLPSLLGGIVKKEGVSGLYRGIVPNMLKVLPAVSISYACYEQMRGFLGIRPC